MLTLMLIDWGAIVGLLAIVVTISLSALGLAASIGRKIGGLESSVNSLGETIIKVDREGAARVAELQRQLSEFMAYSQKNHSEAFNRLSKVEASTAEIKGRLSWHEKD